MGYIMDLRKHVGHAPLIMPSASVILVDEAGRILMQKRVDDGRWGYCGGAMELGETFEECARREILEETGLTCRTLELLTLLSGETTHHFYPNGDEVYTADALFVCRDWEGTLTPQPEEVLELRFCDPKHLPEPLSDFNRAGLAAYLRMLAAKT